MKSAEIKACLVARVLYDGYGKGKGAYVVTGSSTGSTRMGWRPQRGVPPILYPILLSSGPLAPVLVLLVRYPHPSPTCQRSGALQERYGT